MRFALNAKSGGVVWEALHLDTPHLVVGPHISGIWLCMHVGFIPPGGNGGGDGGESLCSPDRRDQARDSHASGWLILWQELEEAEGTGVD